MASLILKKIPVRFRSVSVHSLTEADVEDNARLTLDTARARVKCGIFCVRALALGRRAVASLISLIKHGYIKLFLG